MSLHIDSRRSREKLCLLNMTIKVFNSTNNIFISVRTSRVNFDVNEIIVDVY
jgi:hypothetical protein